MSCPSGGETGRSATSEFLIPALKRQKTKGCGIKWLSRWSFKREVDLITLSSDRGQLLPSLKGLHIILCVNGEEMKRRKSAANQKKKKKKKRLQGQRKL